MAASAPAAGSDPDILVALRRSVERRRLLVTLDGAPGMARFLHGPRGPAIVDRPRAGPATVSIGPPSNAQRRTL